MAQFINSKETIVQQAQDGFVSASGGGVGKSGCLLIVKNHTGDRLNLGLAAERARTFGLKVIMVIVQDDIAIPKIIRPRGVAGTSPDPGLTSALEAGLSRMQEVGSAKPGDRTMIDALHPSLKALPGGLTKAAAAARAGANLTATMTGAFAGRATYVSAKQLYGHIYPGAEAVARLFESLRDSSLQSSWETPILIDLRVTVLLARCVWFIGIDDTSVCCFAISRDTTACPRTVPIAANPGQVAH